MGLARSRRFMAATAPVVAVLALAASPAPGAVTLGQIGPPSVGQCEGVDTLQESVVQGNTYVVPGNGTITSWRTYGGPNPGSLKLKVFRLITAPSVYQVVGHAGPQSVTPNGTAGNTFPASIAVRTGDLLGVNGVSSWCILSAVGGRTLQYLGDLADGASAPFTTPSTRRLNVEATFIPDNTFRLAKARRNKKKGTATLTFDLPNSGQLSGSARGAKVVATSPTPEGSVPAPSTGPTQLVVKAKGKKRAKLLETGGVKLRLIVTYTPTGGEPRTSLLKVKLRKKR